MLEVSIIIPVKNESESIPSCLKAVFSQKARFSFEVIVVDSGSTDGTLDILKDFPIKLIQIKPEEFKHSSTRNLGASKALGKYLVFLNADALPADENWLNSLMGLLTGSEKIAGVYSQHLPRPGCYAFVEKGIYEVFSQNPYKVTAKDYSGAVAKRNYLLQRKLIHFSTVSAALRKEVWQKLPFEDRLIFAEDQGWAKKALENGYSIAYAANSKVYHSHNYTFKQWFQLKYVSFITFGKIFNRTFYRFLLIFPNLVYNLIANPIFALKQDMPLVLKIKEIIRGEAAALVAAGARLCAYFMSG